MKNMGFLSSDTDEITKDVISFVYKIVDEIKTSPVQKEEMIKKLKKESSNIKNIKENILDMGPNAYKYGVSIAIIENKINIILGRYDNKFKVFDPYKKETQFIPIPTSIWSINLNISFLDGL